ncbi:hypothetical protein [Ferrovibrio terrae]|uniref:hypothetical protein n=1 Tax=Ferrovibrio terrae TaxID=2594003 RepID=UPI003137949C
MVGGRWRRLFRISAYAGLFTGALGIAFLLYLLLGAQDVSAAFGTLPILLIGAILLLAAAHGERRHISD